jgi:hypothetical protein
VTVTGKGLARFSSSQMVIAALGGSRLSNLARIFIAMKLKLFFIISMFF